MNEKKWVPGFIWVTPFRHQHESEQTEALPQHLLSLGLIETVVGAIYGNRERGNIYLRGQHEPKAVLETPDEIAELIRREWQERAITTAIAAAQYGNGQYTLKEDLG